MELFVGCVKLFPNARITPADVKRMMKEADIDCNGTIDYREFAIIMEKTKLKSQLWNQAQKSLLDQLRLNVREAQTAFVSATKPLRSFSVENSYANSQGHRVASVGLRIVSFVAYIAFIHLLAAMYANVALPPALSAVLTALLPAQLKLQAQAVNIEHLFGYTDVNLLIDMAHRHFPDYAQLFAFLQSFEVKNTVVFAGWALNLCCMFFGQTLRMHLFGMTVVHEDTGKALDFLWMYTFNMFFLLMWPLDVLALLFTGKSCTERLFGCLIVVTA